MRTPSISSSIDECPNHVTRSPLSGAFRNTRTSVRNGPKGTLGSRSALFLKYSGRTLKARPNPPTVVGTGFKYFPPCFFARSNSPIESFDTLTGAGGSSPLRNEVEGVGKLDADVCLRIAEEIAPLVAEAHEDVVAVSHDLVALLRFVGDGRHVVLVAVSQ